MKNILLLPYFLLLAALLLIHPATTPAQGWVRFITPANIYGDVADAVPHPGGGVVVVFTANSQVQLAHYNVNGDLVWQKTVLTPGTAKDMAIGANGLPSVLSLDLTSTKMVLSHFDWQGNALGSKVLDEYKSGNGKPQLVAFPGGGYSSILTYRDNPATPPTILALHRYDAGDSLLWRSGVDTLVSPPGWENVGVGVNAQGQSIVGTRIGFGANVKYRLTAFNAQGDSM